MCLLDDQGEKRVKGSILVPQVICYRYVEKVLGIRSFMNGFVRPKSHCHIRIEHLLCFSGANAKK